MMRTIPRVAAGACRPTLRPRIAVIHPCLPAGSGGNGSRNPSVHPSIHPFESRHPSTLSLALHSRSRPFGTFPRPLFRHTSGSFALHLSLSRSLPLSLSLPRLVGSSIIASSLLRLVTPSLSHLTIGSSVWLQHSSPSSRPAHAIPHRRLPCLSRLLSHHSPRRLVRGTRLEHTIGTPSEHHRNTTATLALAAIIPT